MYCTKDDAGKLKPSAERWTHNALMGFYWFRVSKYRQDHRISLTLPPWGRLSKEIENLIAQRGQQGAFDFIDSLTIHFDLIRWMNPGVCHTLMLDATSLSNTKIAQTVDRLQAFSPAEMNASYEAIRAGQTFFQYMTPRRKAG